MNPTLEQVPKEIQALKKLVVELSEKVDKIGVPEIVQNDYISREQGAELLNVHRQTFKTWAKAKGLKVYMIGKQHRYKRSDVVSAIEDSSELKVA